MTLYVQYATMSGRMEDIGLFFMPKIDSKALREKTALQTMNLNGGGSRAHKDYTGMYRMYAA